MLSSVTSELLETQGDERAWFLDVADGRALSLLSSAHGPPRDNVLSFGTEMQCRATHSAGCHWREVLRHPHGNPSCNVRAQRREAACDVDRLLRVVPR